MFVDLDYIRHNCCYRIILCVFVWLTFDENFRIDQNMLKSKITLYPLSRVFINGNSEHIDHIKVEMNWQEWFPSLSSFIDVSKQRHERGAETSLVCLMSIYISSIIIKCPTFCIHIYIQHLYISRIQSVDWLRKFNYY